MQRGRPAVSGRQRGHKVQQSLKCWKTGQHLIDWAFDAVWLVPSDRHWAKCQPCCTDMLHLGETPTYWNSTPHNAVNSNYWLMISDDTKKQTSTHWNRTMWQTTCLIVGLVMSGQIVASLAWHATMCATVGRVNGKQDRPSMRDKPGEVDMAGSCKTKHSSRLQTPQHELGRMQ